MSPLMLDGPNILQLIDACISNDRDAQRRLFDVYGGKMMSVCRRYSRSEAEAEDLLQEGFIRVFKYLHTYSKSGSFEGWMRRIFVNVALKTISKKRYSHESVGIDDLPENSIAPSVISKMSADQIMQLVDQLPDGYRTVFNMYVVEGYSHKEIAKQLGVEEATSRSQLVKARRLLRDQITNMQKIAV